MLWNHQCLLFHPLLLWWRRCPRHHVVSILRCMFYLFKIVFFLVKERFSRITHAALQELFSSNSSVASQSYTSDAFVQPSAAVFLQAGLIEDSLTFTAHERVGDFRFYLQFISTGWTPLLHHCGPKTTTKKKGMTMKKEGLSLLFTWFINSSRPDPEKLLNLNFLSPS